MMDLDNTSVSKECVMVCMDVHYEDWDKDIIMYGDQGVSTEEHDEVTYTELMKMESDEEQEIKYNMALCTNDSVSLEKKQRRLNENTPEENVYDISHSDVSINENSTANLFIDKATTVQGPMRNNKKIESQKACTMEMMMNNGNILMTTMIEHEQAKENHKKFLYARAIHANHTMQYHIQQIMECQKVVDEYRSMVDLGRDLIPLESNLFKSDLVVISQIIYRIDMDISWHQKTFGAVLAKLWRNCDKQVYEQENETIYYKEKAQVYEGMDKKEVIDLCGQSKTMTSDHRKAKQKKK